MSDHKDHFQKAAHHSKDEEFPSDESVPSLDKEPLPVDPQQEEAPPEPPVTQVTKAPVPPPYIVVAEHREVLVSVGPTTVIFRPGQHLASPHLIELAKIHKIATKEA